MPRARAGDHLSVVLEAHAKVNLGLEVTGRRDDGRHELRSILVNIDLADTIRLAPGTGTSISGDEAAAVALVEDQEMATRALERLEAMAGQNLGLGIALRKRIPAGAGLGGGSADGAAVLRAADVLGVRVSRERLGEAALELGADVPFQLHGGAALARGVGEVVEPLPHRELWLAIAFGGLHCSTAAVFAELGGDEHSDGALVEAAAAAWRRGDAGLVESIDALPNALWAPATRRYPGALEEIAAALEEGGWRPRLTGSGSAMFQLCRDQAEAQRLALSASTLGFKAWSCKTAAAPSWALPRPGSEAGGR